MITLAIETATTVCGAALVCDGMDPIERVLDIPNIHSERLVPLIETLMTEAGIRVGQLECIAVSIGPGSFTGLRIGLSVAKGISFAAAVPLISVPTLEALAYNVVRTGNAAPGTEIISLLDAHRGDAYKAVYRVVTEHTLEEISRASIAPYGEIAERLQSRNTIIIVGNAQNCITLRPDLRQYWRSELSQCSPVSVGLIGIRRYHSGERADRSSLEPQYLREFVPRNNSGV